MTHSTALLTILLLSTTFVAIGQNIVGKWELDYSSTKDCDGNKIEYSPQQYGKSTLEFSENGKYIRLNTGHESGGDYVVTHNLLHLDEKYNLADKEGRCDRGKYKLGIEKLRGDTLVISFYECDSKILQNFIKKQTKIQEIVTSSIQLELSYSPIVDKTIDKFSVTCVEEGECTITWNGKVITQESHYGTATSFISSMEALGCQNMFILSVYHGDGCPGMYRILEFKDSSSYFLSEAFGNCDVAEVIRVNWPTVEFEFTSSEQLRTPRRVYIYDRQAFTLIEK